MARLSTAAPTAQALGVPFTPALGAGRVRVAVIGGSTPFLHELLVAFGEVDPGVVRFDVRLLGRDPAALGVVGAVAAAVLGRHDYRVTTEAGAALDGADFVLVQPRIGGWGARADDEELAASVGAPADEGLGPGGLSAALRAAPVLRGLAADLRARCPRALVLGFSNPLSTTVARLAEEGLHVVGACELPLATAVEVGARAHVSGSLSWEFTGLNHRGFVHGLRTNGEEVLPALIAALRESDRQHVGGIDVAVIEELGAVPLKYHAMLSGQHIPAAGRARELKAIRDQALVELQARPDVPPAVLTQRSMPWYRQAVVPLLLTLAGVTPRSSMVLDRVCTDGLVRELISDVSHTGIAQTGHSTVDLPAPVRDWIDLFEAHERALETLLREPTTEHLTRVLEKDPATPNAAVGELVRALGPRVDALSQNATALAWWRA